MFDPRPTPPPSNSCSCSRAITDGTPLRLGLLLSSVQDIRHDQAGHLNETTTAVDQLAHARTIANGTATPLLRAWLAAAHGETLAAVGHAEEARRAFDTASDLLPADPIDPALPFLFLGDSHLDRWRGHALARVGAPDAIDQLTAALTHLPADFVRARTSLLVDLTYAHAAAGDREAALTYMRQAHRLAAQIKSDRQQRRLNQLVLPGGSGTAA